MAMAQLLPRFTGAVLHELVKSQSIDLRPQGFDSAQLMLTDAVVTTVAGASATFWSDQAIAALVGAIPKSTAIEAVNVDDQSLKAVVERVAGVFEKASPQDHLRAQSRYEGAADPLQGELAYYQGLLG